MFNDIKKRLLENPDHIINVLEAYEFYKPHIMHNEIRCGLYEGSNTTAIRIKLENNENLFVKDFSRSINLDIINYIIKVRNTDFKSVLHIIKTELGIDSFYDISISSEVFGGFYNRIAKKQAEFVAKTYPDDILNEYKQGYHLKFLHDNIPFQTQKDFGIGYDVASQRITIPIYNQYGELIGVKGRATWEVDDEEPKYIYLVPCPMSSTLYGYSLNFPKLQNNEIWVMEAEKSVMQIYSYGYQNAVAIGSNSLSTMQCKLIMELQPTKIVFLLDKGLDLENTFVNIERLQTYMRMSNAEVWYWDWTLSDLPDKSSPSDYGKETLDEILATQLREYRKDDALLKSNGTSKQIAEDYLTLKL